MTTYINHVFEMIESFYLMLVSALSTMIDQLVWDFHQCITELCGYRAAHDAQGEVRKPFFGHHPILIVDRYAIHKCNKTNAHVHSMR